MSNSNQTIFKFFIAIIILFASTNLKAQDIDVYNNKQDDKVKAPDISAHMSLDEFQLLSRDLRMKDMMYGVIVPGYVHFKAKDNKTGYYLLGARSAAYVGLGAVYFSAKSDGEKWHNIFNDDSSNDILISENWSVEPSDIIVAVSTAIIASTYLYDWIHGQYRLSKKQEMIRYKYGIKLKLEQNHNPTATNNMYLPTASLTLKF